MKQLLFFGFLILVFNTSAFAQIPVINQKGTKILIDSSKWTLSGSNIYNKNVGNVGLGNPSPAYKLDVTGKIRATDSLVANSARIISLSSGLPTDSIVVADPATGILKRISANRLDKADSTTASNGLSLSGKDIRLGGTLNSATTITNSGANTLRVAGLTSGDLNDSLVVSDPVSGELFRVSSSRINKTDSTTASNGLSLSGKDIRLGGALTAATTITTSGANTLALAGLTSGSLGTDSFLVINGSTNVVRRVSNILPQILVVAHRTSAYTIAATFNTLVYDSAPTNIGSTFNTSSGVFTAPATGLYQILVNNTYQTSSATNNYIKNRIIVNGSTDMEITLAITPYSGATVSTLVANSIVSLNSGETMSISQGGEVGTMASNTGAGLHTIKIIRLK